VAEAVKRFRSLSVSHHFVKRFRGWRRQTAGGAGPENEVGGSTSDNFDPGCTGSFARC